MALTPVSPLDRTSTTFRSDCDTFFGSTFPQFVGEANALAANLNSIAAGGAYAIPYVFSSAATTGFDPGAGYLRLGASPENTSPSLTLSQTSAAAQGVLALLQGFADSTSATKGSIRLVKQGDPSKWLVFSVTSRSQGSGYDVLFGGVAAASEANPFAAGDAVMLQFQRTGDKGDIGAAYIPQVFKVSDRKTFGTPGGDAATNTAQARTLNTIEYNTMGASLSANRVTLPAGTYLVEGRAPAYNVQGHQVGLFNVTDNTYAVYGAPAYCEATAAIQTDSTLSGYFVFGAARTFELRHWTQVAKTANGLGCGLGGSSGQSAVFAELSFTKIA